MTANNLLPIPESYWVLPGQFLAGEYPAHSTEALARRRLSAFLEAGITDFIDLTQPNELPSYESLLKELAALYDLNARYARFPIRDSGAPGMAVMLDILDAIDEALKKGRKIYVHCWGGIGRTGTAVACFLVRHGEQPQKALAQVDALYHTRRGNPFFLHSPENEGQIQFVLDWREPTRYCEG